MTVNTKSVAVIPSLSFPVNLNPMTYYWNLNEIGVPPITNSAGTTYPVTASGGPIGLGVNGYCYLPSGQKLRWGSATTTGTTVTVNLAAPPSMFPAINQIFTIQLTAINTNCIFWATASTGGTFTVNSSVANSTFNYLVIGQ